MVLEQNKTAHLGWEKLDYCCCFWTSALINLIITAAKEVMFALMILCQPVVSEQNNTYDDKHIAQNFCSMSVH